MMKCGHCAHEAERYPTLNPDDTEREVHECAHCRRRRVFTLAGWA